jgi:hypothetical protein
MAWSDGPKQREEAAPRAVSASTPRFAAGGGVVEFAGGAPQKWGVKSNLR